MKLLLRILSKNLNEIEIFQVKLSLIKLSVILGSVPILQPLWLHRCLWRMLEKKRVNGNFKMLVTVLAISVTKLRYLFHKSRPSTFKRCHQHQNFVTKIQNSSSILSHQHHCLGYEIFKTQSGCRILKFWKVAVTLVWTGNFDPLFPRDPFSYFLR